MMLMMMLTKLALDHAGPTARAAFAGAASGSSLPAPAADLTARAGLRHVSPQANRMRSPRSWSAGLLRVQSQANRTSSSHSWPAGLLCAQPQADRTRSSCSWLAGLLRVQPQANWIRSSRSWPTGLPRAQLQAALSLLERAHALASAHPAPVITRYRFHFYSHALPSTRAVGEDVPVIGLLRAQPQANRTRSPRPWLADLLRAQPQAALPLLERARALASAHPVPVIARYRFHFYGHALPPTRTVGEDATVMARGALGASFGTASFDAAPLAAALFTNAATRHNATVRFPLFTLKSLACLDVRLLCLGDPGACPRPPAGPRWAAIGMGWRPMSRCIDECPCKRLDRPITRSRPNPNGRGCFRWSAALRRLSMDRPYAACRALPPTPKRPPRGLPGDREQALIAAQRRLAGLRRLNLQDHAGGALPQYARNRYLADGSLMAIPNPAKRRARTRCAAGWRGSGEVMAAAFAIAPAAFVALAASVSNIGLRRLNPQDHAGGALPQHARNHRLASGSLMAIPNPAKRCARTRRAAGWRGRGEVMAAAFTIAPAAFVELAAPVTSVPARTCGRHLRARALFARLASDADAAARRLGQQARKARETRSSVRTIRPTQSVQPIQEGGHA